jgi:hypothetical protein
MMGEALLNILIPTISLALALHSLIRRGRRIALLCLFMGMAFGALFPLSHVRIFHSYSFSFLYQILGLPPFLPLFWWCVFYVSLWLSERIAGHFCPIKHGAVFTAMIAGLVMLVMEIIWDDLAVRGGVLSFQGMSYLWYRPDFHNGIAPQINATHFIFAYVYVYTIKQFEKILEIVSLTRLVIVGLLMMLSLFLVGLYFEILRVAALDSWLNPITALSMDIGVSLAAVVICVLQTSYLYTILGRKILREVPE